MVVKKPFLAFVIFLVGIGSPATADDLVEESVVTENPIIQMHQHSEVLKDSNEKKHAEMLLKTIYVPDERICAPGGLSQYYRTACRNQKYCLYRADDIKREKPLCTLEILNNNGFIYPIDKMTLTEIQSRWGEGRRDTRIKKSPTLPEGPGNPRIFDLVALDENNQPIFFHVMFKFKDELSDLYTVDGPGIHRLDYKNIKSKGEAN